MLRHVLSILENAEPISALGPNTACTAFVLQKRDSFAVRPRRNDARAGANACVEALTSVKHFRQP
jgi:hypothetical protein